MYKQINRTDEVGNITPVTNAIKRILDNAFIPFAPDNTDYQAYLKWVAEGGIPTPADE